jgi:hypothetical protein
MTDLQKIIESPNFRNYFESDGITIIHSVQGVKKKSIKVSYFFSGSGERVI